MFGKYLLKQVTRDLTGGIIGGLGHAAAFGAGAVLVSELMNSRAQNHVPAPAGNYMPNQGYGNTSGGQYVQIANIALARIALCYYIARADGAISPDEQMELDYMCSSLLNNPNASSQFFTSTIDDPDKKGEKVKVNYSWNLFFSALAGTTWYFQFFFYSMGETRMGEYQFSSWTLHMASIIIFSSLWGLCLHEWKGTSRFTKFILGVAIFTLIYSTIVVGYGNLMKQVKAEGIEGGEAAAIQSIQEDAGEILEEIGETFEDIVD